MLVAVILACLRSDLEKEMQPTPVFLPGESHGQRILAGHGPWGRRESDMTEETKHTHILHDIFVR